MPIYTQDGLVGALVAQRRLTEVTTAVDQVRNALIVAAGLGMLVAVALGVALSSTLLRRLARLRAAALRITAEGPDAPSPRDDGRDEVGDLARTLARMQEALRRQEVARRSFVSTASHELRTPLTMLQGTMELLEEDLRDGRVDIEDAQLQVTNARRELRRLSTLAGELLDLSRLDAAVQLRSEPVELGELARAVAAEFDLRARELDVELRVMPPADGCWGRGDPDAVARVVRILLDNALRYGPRGQVIALSVTCGGTTAGVSVADRGPGIPAEEREHVFERFHRGRDAGPESGFGLGLAIGRELAERMGGHLRLADREPPGACFVLTLPIAEPEGRADAARAVAGAGGRVRRISGGVRFVSAGARHPQACWWHVTGCRVPADAGRARRRTSVAYRGLDEHRRLEGARATLERLCRLGGADREARVVGDVLAPLARLLAHQLGPRRLPAPHVEEDRRHQRHPLAGLELVEQRREVALRRGRPEPLGAVAPVGDAGVAHRAGERREAHAVGQVVVQHRDLLGLCRDHEVAGAQAGADRLRDCADVALLVRRRVSGRQRGRHDQARRSPAGPRSRGRP